MNSRVPRICPVLAGVGLSSAIAELVTAQFRNLPSGVKLLFQKP